MVIITGAAGFIGSALLAHFNRLRPDLDLILVDNFSVRLKDRNYRHKKWISMVERGTLTGFLEENHHKVDFIFHLGARTDTAETNVDIFDRLNLNYSKNLWKLCVRYGIPLVYASSAATYGNGAMGYSDDHQLIGQLKPLNPYGQSKQDFDEWVLRQKDQPSFWAGLKFFNVYGPNEYHKGRMASVVFHAFNQIRVEKKVTLFRSHRSDFADGEQARDFIYIKDILAVCEFLLDSQTQIAPGIYNVGTGMARSFNDLAAAVFSAMGIQPHISYVDMPTDIRSNYQYFTEADIKKLQAQGFDQRPYSLEEGIRDYVVNYLFDRSYL